MEEFTATHTCQNDLKEFNVNVNLPEIDVIRKQAERLIAGRHPTLLQSCTKEFLSFLGTTLHLIHHTSQTPSLPIITIPFPLHTICRRFHVLKHSKRPHLLCLLWVGLHWAKQMLNPGKLWRRDLSIGQITSAWSCCALKCLQVW